MFPGCAGLEWIYNNHSLKRGDFGVVDNEWRNDTEESAGKIGIDFLVNAVLNYKREIIGLYCGDWIKAHREGIDLSLKASAVKLPYKADFCIASSSPFRLELHSNIKGFRDNANSYKRGWNVCDVNILPPRLRKSSLVIGQENVRNKT